MLTKFPKNSAWTTNQSGIIVPDTSLKMGGVFTIEHWRDGKLLDSAQFKNKVVNQFLDYALDVSLSSGTPKTSWYIGLFKANYTPLATNTGATIAAAATELTEYTSSTRIAWADAGPASNVITNAASKAEFTINGTVTAYGAFLVSSNVKGDTNSASILCAASKFTTSRDLVANDQLLVTYQLTASDAGV